MRDIEAGEEITYDYKFRSFRLEENCACNSAQCRGKICSESNPLKLKIGKKFVDALQMPMQNNSKKERNLIQRSRIFLMRNYNKVRRNALKENQAEFENNKKAPTDPSVSQLIALKKVSSWRNRIGSGNGNGSEMGIEESRWINLTQLLKFWFGQISDSFSSLDHSGVGASGIFFNSMAEKISAAEFRKPEEFLIEIEKMFAKIEKNFTNSNVLEKILLEQAKRLNLKICAEATELLQLWGFDTSSFDSICLKNSEPLVGSYDPDDESGIFTDLADDLDPKNVDKVRCICGILLEEGEMIQCERCKYWQHQECERVEDCDRKYFCYRCNSESKKSESKESKKSKKSASKESKKSESKESKDILLEPQPKIRFPGCQYYRTLTNARLQVRVDEAVYVKRFIDEKYKERLRVFYKRYANGETKEEAENGKNRDEERMDIDHSFDQKEQSDENEAKKLYFHNDLRVFRVERLLMSPE